MSNGGINYLFLLNFLKYWKLISGLSLSLFLIMACEDSATRLLQGLQQSVLKINVVSQSPNVLTPWIASGEKQSSGSGFYIGEGRIITNAHVVANARFITVKRGDSGRSVVAEVLYIAHDCDLALLEVSDQQYFKDVSPLTLGTLPPLHSRVITVGYPIGGEQLSLTEGVVSRIDYSGYVHDQNSYHLLVQVDAAINSGNSGGPVLQDGKVVGVAFESLKGADNTGYMIPVEIMRHFLDDIEDGEYDGFPASGLFIQRDALMNPSLRLYYQLPDNLSGVLVSLVTPYSPLINVLHQGDIVLAIDDYDIAADATVNYKGNRVLSGAIFDLYHIGDEVNLTLWREQRKKIVKFKAQVNRNIPSQAQVFSRPRYYTLGGLVFTPLTRNFFSKFGGQSDDESLLILRHIFWRWYQEPEFQSVREVVVLNQVLSHPMNARAERFEDNILLLVNDQPIKSLNDIKKIFESSDDQFMRFQFYRNPDPLVLSRADITKWNKVINDNYGVHPPEWLHWPPIHGGSPQQLYDGGVLNP